jgi:predicted DCC family thiol-disulfide oxidoreductase YuxK
LAWTLPEPTEREGRTWVIFDGDCGICNRYAKRIRELDVRRELIIVPYQAAPDPPATDAVRGACEHAVHVVLPTGQVLRAGRAWLHLRARLQGGLLVRVLAIPPFSWLLEVGYWLVARNRHVFSRLLLRTRRGRP